MKFFLQTFSLKAFISPSSHHNPLAIRQYIVSCYWKALFARPAFLHTATDIFILQSQLMAVTEK